MLLQVLHEGRKDDERFAVFLLARTGFALAEGCIIAVVVRFGLYIYHNHCAEVYDSVDVVCKAPHKTATDGNRVSGVLYDYERSNLPISLREDADGA